MSTEAALSPWWLIGFWLLIGGIGTVFTIAAILEWSETRSVRRARQASMRRHPTVAVDLLAVVADVDRQFQDRDLYRPHGAGHVTVTGPHTPAQGGRAGDGVPTRKRPVDLRRDDILADGVRVLDRGWPNTLNRFTVPVISVNGVYGQRHWSQSDASRFDNVEVRP